MKYLDDFDIFNESFYDNEVLDFLYKMDAIRDEVSEGSSESWSKDLYYEFDENVDYIEVSLTSSGYSEGFSLDMKIYYKGNMIGPIKVEYDEGSSSSYGDIKNNGIKYFDDYDLIIDEIKSHFGIE